jgi:OFA family oxalate/formate antiporter-like MFS transporter
LLSGILSDKLGALKTLQITFAVSFAASILLYFTNETKVAFFYIGIACIGFCFGSIMGIYPGFTAKKFGRKHNSVNYGIMFIGFALAGLFGPTLMNKIYNTSGKY